MARSDDLKWRLRNFECLVRVKACDLETE